MNAAPEEEPIWLRPVEIEDLIPAFNRHADRIIRLWCLTLCAFVAIFFAAQGVRWLLTAYPAPARAAAIDDQPDSH